MKRFAIGLFILLLFFWGCGYPDLLDGKDNFNSGGSNNSGSGGNNNSGSGNNSELFLHGDIVGSFAEEGDSLSYQGQGLYTYTFTYNETMDAWGSSVGEVQFKLRTVAGNWDEIAYGCSDLLEIGGKKVLAESGWNASNFYIYGVKVGTTYTIYVECVDGNVYVSIKESTDGSSGSGSSSGTPGTGESSGSTGSWEQVPAGASMLAAGNTMISLNSGETHYYYTNFQAGMPINIQWMDRFDYDEMLVSYLVTDIDDLADVKVSIYLAGETNSSNFVCNNKDNGWKDPVRLSSDEDVYYVIEVSGHESYESGLYTIGYNIIY